MNQETSGPPVDLGDASRFLTALDFDNDADAQHAFSTFPDSEHPTHDEVFRLTRNKEKHLGMFGDLDSVVRPLVQLNQDGAGVHVVLNQVDLHGHLTALRAICCKWSKQDAARTRMGVIPSIVVRSPAGIYLYWLLHRDDGDFGEYCDKWLRAQSALERQHDSVADARSLDFKVRVPGFSYRRQRPLDTSLYRRGLEEIRFKIESGALPFADVHHLARREYELRGGEFSPIELVQLEKCDPKLRYEIGRIVRGLELEDDRPPFIVPPDMIKPSADAEQEGVAESNSVDVLGDVPPPRVADARRYLAALDPTAERFTYQTYDDGHGRGKLAHILHGSFDEVLRTLEELNGRGGAVQVTVNATDFQGRKNQNIISTRAFFCDWDDMSPPRGTGALPLSMMVSREVGGRRKYHGYWLLSESVEAAKWKLVQRALVHKLSADEGAILLNQALRLPGFYNCKKQPSRVELEECHPDRRYTVDQIIETYELESLIKPPPPKPTRTSDGDGPADDYAARGDWSVLERHGWTVALRDGDEVRWTKPGGTRKKVHATTDHAGHVGIFKCFSSKAPPFVADQGYTRFQVLAELEHGGDGSATAKALVEQGYGKSTAERKQEWADANEEARWGVTMDSPEAQESMTVTIEGPTPPDDPWFDGLSKTESGRGGTSATKTTYRPYDGSKASSGGGGNLGPPRPLSSGGGNGDGDGDGDDGLTPRGDGNAPEIFELSSFHTVARGPDNIPMTHVGNRERFLDRYGHLVRYVKTFNCWYVWNGLRWRQDADAEETHVRPPAPQSDDLASYIDATTSDPFDAGNFVMELGMQAARAMHALVKHIYVRPSNDANNTTGSDGKKKKPKKKSEMQAEVDKWVGHCVRTESEGSIIQMLNLARSNRAIARFPSYFDPYDHLINTQRGVQDLRTGLYYPHHPGLSQSKLVRIKPNRSGCPIWTRFLERVLKEDDELIRFVQRAVGYSLTGETREQVLFLLYGTGKNGKSTFLNVLHALAGEYAQHAEFSTFIERQSEMVRNDLARLHKSRLVTAVEPKSTGYLDEAVIKQVTGQDVVTARFLFQEHFEYLPRFKIWLAANHKPMIRGNDEGIWRRILMVPFTVTIPEEEKDPDLPHKLVAELPAIFSWAADGARLWYEEGLRVPAAVREATQAYRDDMDSIGMFLHVKCVATPNVRSMATALYRHYVKWAETGGERPMSQKKFGMRLEERGIEKKRETKGYMYVGIAIREDAPQDEQAPQAYKDR